MLNAIFGSVLMSGSPSLVGTPIGIFAGTYLAEYGRHGRLAFFVRFVNDILLSAPSIVIGLFIYEVDRACRWAISRRWAGVAALAVIVIPVVVRTTENMLLLVPNGLREAAAALGAPRAQCHPLSHLARRAGGHRHRRAARRRAHLGRNRAAPVHRAQQPVLEHRPERSRWQVCRSPSSSSP